MNGPGQRRGVRPPGPDADDGATPIAPARARPDVPPMSRSERAAPNHAVTAVLGPTNTGKTHLAVERMCGHASGIMGFPLRLLAREVYDRVVRLKGPAQVALLTGEERICPPQARWFLCTAESMPTDRDAAFLALDEAQLGTDAERGHVFTDRLLHARGREETMILGSDALRPMIRALVPGAEIVERPRFSTLSYAGARKLSRLPKRSAIVAFSAEEVYAVAEMLRRLRGGAAVVMGALSPRTRNAQVQMFQAGEVDYLVATDAIGMGLNMDVAHVAFAGLHKFDGRRRRRLTVAEMAQIAGRAGRHQRDGTFGALAEEGPEGFLPEEVLAIEEHRFPRIEHLYWRDGAPDFASLDALIASLERRPDPTLPLRPAPQAVDLAVLKRLADEPWVRDRARSPVAVRRLWAACGVPDFRKVGLDPHSRFVARLYGHLSDGSGHIPHQWFADELQRLDSAAGDVETIAGRVASVRSWAYIAHRSDWLADPAHWAERTRAVEERLSDALHASLTQRFVDKRTTALIRRIGADAGALPVEVAADGAVTVEDQPIGRLDGFRFSVAPDARAADKRLLLAAAEKRLAAERARRADALADAADADLTLTPAGEVEWRGHSVGRLSPGRALARPKAELHRDLDCLARAHRERVVARLRRFTDERAARLVPGLPRLADLSRDPAASPALRSVAGALEAAGGIAARAALGPAVEALAPDERRALRAAGITLGTLDLFDPRLLKPAAAAYRAVLMAVAGRPVAVPPPGAAVLARADAAAGFRPFAHQALRVDLAERIARAAHDARDGRTPFRPDPALATSLGLLPATLDRLMAELGFRPAPEDEAAPGPRWTWRGRGRPRAAPPAPARPGSAFAGLAELVGHRRVGG